MATFTAKPVEGQDPWGATDLAWRASVESAVNTVEGTADAALPSAQFDTRLGTRVKVDNTVGRTVSVWDASNSRWQLVYGDTGWRDVTSLLINGWTANSVSVRRIDYQVHLAIEGLNPSAQTGLTFIDLGSAYTFSNATGARGVLSTATSPVVNYRTSRGSGTDFQCIAPTSAGLLYGQLIGAVTSAWPTTLPGTAVGTIPNA